MNYKIIDFKPKILKKYFDLKVREMCKSCKRYSYKASCPPYIESVDYYKKWLPTFKQGKLVIYKFKLSKKDIKNWEELGKKSSLDLSDYLLKSRNNLMKEGHWFVIVYGDGSCKNCQKCSFPCRFPNKAITPFEGTGVNIVKLMKDLAKIELKYPVEKFKEFFRIGVILYD